MKFATISFFLLLLASVNSFAQDEYVSWTFDDFNQNGDVIDDSQDTTQQENSDDIKIEYGELGW